MREPSIVVVSFNTRRYLERSLGAVDGKGHEVVVVDNASTDGSAQLVRERFPEVRLIELTRNVGFGAAANRGLEATAGRYCLVMNEDAWPQDDQALGRLVACAERDPRAGILGPRLLTADGRTHVSVVGMPTRWWTGAPAVSSAPPRRFGRAALAPRGRQGRFLVGAVLLMRRQAIDEVGAFDPAFFMFGDEVDLCRRMQRAGWRVELCPEAVFVHVGGAATQRDWPLYYREQVRGHLRQLAKYEGGPSAEQARRFLRVALRVRALVGTGEARTMYRETASWLGSGHARTLLAPPGRTPQDRTAAAEDRTSGNGG